MPRSRMRKRLAMLLLLAMPTLTACETLTTVSGGTELPPEIDPAKVACAVFKPITWSSRDTPETVREVKSHNAAWKAICGQEV